ncbi:hypothetical protein EVG20_g3136 [Dentipellis fragilis]|uniref:F-box domain-containing protein n=1 Tax=Dentipellis fragilis TaxID=205917 RepID=A0A4Y9Z4V4_9AGAM|nr:hypothetical protein EVG20_g3136 [Dentipellis fragilis]
MCALHTQRNALQPIARLPPEVLSSIFHLVANTEQPYPRTRPYPPLYGSPGSLGWILLSHVCRSWRAVALRDTALWANSMCALPSATAEFLRRAHTAPLTIRHDFGRYRHKSRVLQAVLLALEHLPRTRELRIRANKRILERLADALHDKPAPALESLELALAADARIGFFYETVRLPTHLLTASPCLRRLVLENCRLPWDSELLRNLTHLEVRLVVFSVPDLMLPTTTQLLTVLARCPELQTLALIDSLPEVPDDTPLKPAPQPVHLSALTRLTLAGKPLACANLVQNLRFPSTATLELTCTGLGKLDELRTTVGPLLKPHTGVALRRLSMSATMSDIAVHAPRAHALFAPPSS